MKLSAFIMKELVRINYFAHRERERETKHREFEKPTIGSKRVKTEINTGNQSRIVLTWSCVLFEVSRAQITDCYTTDLITSISSTFISRHGSRGLA